MKIKTCIKRTICILALSSCPIQMKAAEVLNKFETKGLKSIKGHLPEEISQLVSFLKSPYRFNLFGAKMPQGYLFVGPPGNGKTHVARCLAEELDVSFFSVCVSDFFHKYYGEASKAINGLFDKAQYSQKQSIIFIDEIDAIGSRGDHNVNPRAIATLLHRMDGFKKTDSIVIGATNDAASLDPALKRPGRFDRIIYFPLPNISSRKEILQFYAQGTAYDSGIDFDDLSQATEGLSIAALKHLVNEATILAAMKKNNVSVTQVEYNEALRKLKVRESISNSRSLLRNPKTNNYFPIPGIKVSNSFQYTVAKL